MTYLRKNKFKEDHVDRQILNDEMRDQSIHEIINKVTESNKQINIQLSQTKFSEEFWDVNLLSLSS